MQEKRSISKNISNHDHLNIMGHWNKYMSKFVDIFIVSHITIISIYIMGQRNTCPSLWTFMVFLTRPRGVCSLVESTFCDVSRGVRITLLMITMNIHMIVMVSSSNNWRRQCSLTKDCPRHQVTVGGGLPPASQVNVRDSPEVRNVVDKPSYLFSFCS